MSDRAFKILIADEQVKSVEFLKEHLQAYGYRITGVTSGKELQDICKKEKFDLLILSLTLKDVDSLNICREIKKSPQTSDLPVLFITSHRETEEKLRALESGADDFVTKPFNLEELNARIRSILRSKISKDVLKQRTRILEDSALRDELTGLYNRRYIIERMYEEISRSKRFSHIVSCVIFDIDQFKSLNDTYGVECANNILTQTALVIKENVRAEDIVGRFGGEEFVIVLPQTDLEGALTVAEKLRETIGNKNIDIKGASLNVTVSMGVSSTEVGEDEDLLYYADLALDKAKKSGRNKVIAWKKEEE
ncbi:MAG: diguanylate cyclase [Armatimonadota bacterium]